MLSAGTNVITQTNSQVDLFLKQNGPVIRVTPNTVLTLERLLYEETPTGDAVIETVLALPQGRILGNVKKLAKDSKYVIQIPKGYIMITGTEYDLRATGKLALNQGEAAMTYLQPSGQLATFTVHQGESFMPPDRIVPIPHAEAAVLNSLFHR